jgi:non-specific serine/threonine protein kinase/serine/threonine-protein kinase
MMEPDRPSVAVTTGDPADTSGKRQRRLRGDLDTILLTALRKEPDRRYQSVDQFAEDVKRHLAGLPVRAQPDTFRYRTGKFVRRNRVAVVAGTITTIALVASVIVSVASARDARAAQASAERRFSQVHAFANTVIFDYYDAVKDLRGATPVLERLVHDGLQYLDGLAAERTTDLTLRRDLASAYVRMGDVQGGRPATSLGDNEGAIASYGKALTILETLYRDAPADTFARDNLAYVLSRQAGGCLRLRAHLTRQSGQLCGSARQPAAGSPIALRDLADLALHRRCPGRSRRCVRRAREPSPSSRHS